jgi:hypothetical protein
VGLSTYEYIYKPLTLLFIFFQYRIEVLQIGLSMGQGGGDAPFLAPPRTPAGWENCTRKPHKMGRTRAMRVVRGYAGLIPRSRKMRNQTKARFSQEPNKKIRFKQYRIQTRKSQTNHNNQTQTNYKKGMRDH